MHSGANPVSSLPALVAGNERFMCIDNQNNNSELSLHVCRAEFMWTFVCKIAFILDICHRLDPGLSKWAKLGLDPVVEMSSILTLFNKQTAE